MDKTWKQTEKYCLECGKKLEIKIRRDVDRKAFCSVKCRNRSNGRKRMSDLNFKARFIESGNAPEINLKKSNKLEKHPRWKGGKIKKNCVICNTEFFTTRCRDKEGCGKYCSMECYRFAHIKPRTKSKCLQCGKEVELTEKRLRRFKFCSGTCRAIYNRVHGYKRINLIESRVEVILKELNVFYQFEKDVENIAVVDFLLPNKICIFCDGIYWHERDKERDDFVNKYLLDNGYIVLRFTDEEINNQISGVKSKLEDVLKAR